MRSWWKGLVVASAVTLMAMTRGTAGDVLAAPAQAGTPSGWAMVGMPNHSNYSLAEALFRWNSGTQQYENVYDQRVDIGSDAQTCPGYWAYFAAVTSVTLPVSGAPGDTRSCALSAGWNLVGNPFSLPATLPAGVTAYHWDQATSTYGTVSTIPVGASVWIFETSAASLTLTASG